MISNNDYRGHRCPEPHRARRARSRPGPGRDLDPRTLIVSVSGDGGYNEVVDGVMQAGATGTVFHRGEKPIQLVDNGPVKEEPGRAGPTMWAISACGPFYAAPVTGGTLDTKGGPRTNPDGQVLDDTGAPSQACTGSATASPRRPRRATGREGRPSARSSPSPTGPHRPPTGNRPADPGLTPSRERSPDMAITCRR
jgi:hypothetical protein